MAELYYKNSLSLIYTHEGLKQAGGHEEPGHADPRRPRRSEPQQQVGEDGKRGGQNQPRTQTSAEWDTCIRSPASIQMELLQREAPPPADPPGGEFSDARPGAAAHQVSDQRVRHGVPGPAHKQNQGHVEGLHLRKVFSFESQDREDVSLRDVLYLDHVQKKDLQGRRHGRRGYLVRDPTHSVADLPGQWNPPRALETRGERTNGSFPFER